MIDEVKQHLDELATILGSLAVVVAAIRWFKPIWGWVVRVWTRPERVEEMLERINYAIFNDGNGIERQMARLSGCHTVAFENEPFPAFECDASGNNSRVNNAYRHLIGISTEQANQGNRWHQAVYGELADDYHAEFVRCSEAREDFIGDADFRNPLTGEHRGRWKVHAPCINVGRSCIFIGRFIAALDEKAMDLSDREDWDVRISRP